MCWRTTRDGRPVKPRACPTNKDLPGLCRASRQHRRFGNSTGATSGRMPFCLSSGRPGPLSSFPTRTRCMGLPGRPDDDNPTGRQQVGAPAVRDIRWRPVLGHLQPADNGLAQSFQSVPGPDSVGPRGRFQRDFGHFEPVASQAISVIENSAAQYYFTNVRGPERVVRCPQGRQSTKGSLRKLPFGFYGTAHASICRRPNPPTTRSPRPPPRRTRCGSRSSCGPAA